MEIKDETIRTCGQVISTGVIFLAVISLFSLRGRDLYISIVWFALMALGTLGLLLAGWPSWRELKERRKELLNQFSERLLDQDILSECKERDDQREAIRKGLAEDDGFTELGRDFQRYPHLETIAQRLETMGVSVGETRHDIFRMEKSDRRIQAAWRRKIAANDAWEKIRNERFG